MQEICRKDVEKAFGVLQARFAIVRRPTRLWYSEDLVYVMKTCIILHKMIVEDGREDDVEAQHANLLSTTPIEVERNAETVGEFFFTQHRRMRSSYEHNRLRMILSNTFGSDKENYNLFLVVTYSRKLVVCSNKL
ncbi:hypothetical protein Droror1_Dr00016842 [Drosera rotundifolia]